MNLEIYLVRHGQTEFNQAGRIQGWCDSPLTNEGRQQAKEAGKRLAAKKIHFDAAFSSTSPRAIDTAHILLTYAGQPTLTIQKIAQLREYHFGSFEGGLSVSLHEQIAKRLGYPNREAWLQSYRNGQHNQLAQCISQIDPDQSAEDETAFLARLYDGLHRVIAQSPPGNGRMSRVLVVSHGMAITAILKSINASAILYKSVPNGSITQLHYTLMHGFEIVNIAEQGLLGSKDRPTETPPSQVAKTLAKRRL